MGNELLLEIGTEEIPAAFLPKALGDIEEIIRRELSANRICRGKIRTMGTPRRLFLAVDDVAERQDDQLIEKLGPARKVAFDKDGNPSPAALGFARGQCIDVNALETATTEKVEYLCARKKITGEPTEGLLPAIMSRLIADIPFRKSMRWSDLEIRFARPIHWILALYAGRIIPFRIGNIESGCASRGHRFMSPASFPVGSREEYLTKTREQFVIVDPVERTAIIREETRKAAAAVGGSVLQNDELLEQVTFLTEYPTVVCGNFAAEYLKLPREVLVTTMIAHQKYFPVVDEKGTLLPHFLTINNTLAHDPAVVKRGNEKVIRARLADARFFFDEDRKIPLEKRVEDLRKVTFHTLLGNSYEKVTRFRTLAGRIVRMIPTLGDTAAFIARVDEAALLAKADLDTQMVCEFAELQGIMGREYALLEGRDPIVAKAIYEHYLPTSAGGDLPETDEGAIVSIADKMDTICGFFGVGLTPTGTADPYALRRQALGIINIILKKRYPLSLDTLIDESIATLGGLLKRPAEETKADVLEFFRGRFENQLLSLGHPYDVVDAVLATGIRDLTRAEQKIRAMEEFKSHPDFAPLAGAFKRVANIIRNFRESGLDPALFTCAEERDLHEAFLDIHQLVMRYCADGEYQAALIALAQLRKPVDAFFEVVLVMADEEKIRCNRLTLLTEISTLFYDLADFSKIVTEG
jgi:glycyl-tRNA synthetase beta chain